MIPKELKNADRWVNWSPVLEDGKTKKIPKSPTTGNSIDVTKSANWSTFDKAVEGAAKFTDLGQKFSLGFALGDGFIGVDLDHAIKNGKLLPWAEEIVRYLNSYTEISPSGDGVHVICMGKLPIGQRRFFAKIEVYDDNRYFTVTGNEYDGPKAVENRTKELKNLHEQWTSDNESLNHMSGTSTGGTIKALWLGDASGYPSHSEADMAFCNYLAIEYDGEFGAVNRMFRLSGLWRPKWEEFRGVKSYGEITIESAITSYRLSKSSQLQQQATGQFKSMDHNDYGNGKRILDLYSDDIYYVPNLGVFTWSRDRWKRDNDYHQMVKFAFSMAEAYFQFAQLENDKRKRMGMEEWARMSQNISRAKLGCETAKVFAREIDISKFDDDPLLFNCPNGVINLETGKISPHSRENLITKMCPVNYDPEAKAPRFEAFMSQIMGGDPEKVGFIQRAAGYSITGYTSEQCLFFCYGSGRNGKSTFMEILQAVMGYEQYSTKLSTEVLTYRKNDGAKNTDLIQMLGTRLVVASEIASGDRLNESLIKDLTGGDRINARALYHEAITFSPIFTLWMYGNHRPKIKDMDDGIWRRVRLIPFTVQIKEEEVDTGLLQYIIDNELEGVLAWMVKGAMEWKKTGLRPTKEIEDSTRAYRTAMDSISQFIDERMEVDEENIDGVSLEQVYEAYKLWCTGANAYPMQLNAFNEELEKRQEKFGFEKYLKGKKGRVFWRYLKIAYEEFSGGI